MLIAVASASLAVVPPALSTWFIAPAIVIDPIVYEAEIPVLVSSSAAPSISTACLPADTDRFSFTATEIP